MRDQKRHRRKSGSSLHVAPRQWLLLDASTITDDETEQEERLEMESRRRTGSPVAQRQHSRLKRASRSQVHLHTRATLSAVVDAEEVNPTFNFSKPITPPVRSPKSSEPQVVSDGSERSTPEPIEPLPQGNITSATEEAEVSETIPSSDHGEDTDASDNQTYKVYELADTPNKALTVDEPHTGPATRAGWILWD
jgi:TAG lipase/steryl ester hydrolase/phospholipase A2/LPA acyltransferase